jgi:hypothetical protein
LHQEYGGITRDFIQYAKQEVALVTYEAAKLSSRMIVVKARHTSEWLDAYRTDIVLSVKQFVVAFVRKTKLTASIQD